MLKKIKDYLGKINSIEENLQKLLIEITSLEKNTVQMYGGGDAKSAVLFAYRYLLGREPENYAIIEGNNKSWQILKKEIESSQEFNDLHSIQDSDKRFFTDAYSANYFASLKRLDYEKCLENSYRKIIKQGDTVVDIGAHIGRHSRVFAELIGKTGKLFSFEPLPKQFEILKKEFQTQNVTLVNKALSNEVGNAEFNVVENYPEESGLKKRIYNMPDAVTTTIFVDVDVLDNYINTLNGLSYIKIDAEGAELNILNGARETIKQFAPIISIEYGYPSYSVYGLTKDSLFDFCETINYVITDVWGNVIHDRDMWRDLCDSVYWDYFLVPRQNLKDFSLRIHADLCE